MGFFFFLAGRELGAGSLEAQSPSPHVRLTRLGFSKSSKKTEQSRISGTRTREVALAEFKHITRNEYVIFSATNGHRGGAEEDEGEGGMVDPCVCGLRKEADSL